MPEWEMHTEADWLDRITECWMDAGSAALRSRGQFTVALDASPECLQACRHLTGMDWPWSATYLLPVRENCVPLQHARHCGSAIYQALYPKKVNVQHWKTEHISHQQSVERYAKTLKKEAGEQPKIDLTLIALAGENTLGEVEADESGIPEYELTALYQTKSRALPTMGLTPWLLNAARHTVCISKGLNPPVTDSLGDRSPLPSLTAKEDRITFLHTR